MIQRAQTLYFMAILALTITMMFGDIPFYKTSSSTQIKTEDVNVQIEVEYDERRMISENKISTIRNTSLFYFIGCIALISLISIFTFKNRKLQATLTGFNFLFILVVVFLMYQYSYGMKYNPTNTGTITVGSVLPILIILLNLLGFRGIKKDEKLIRSMDRLR